MKKFNKASLTVAVAAVLGMVNTASADVLDELLKDSKVYGNINVRSESVDFNGASANAITMRSWFGFKSGTYNGFSTLIEFEDVRPVLGNDESGNLIPDPDQALTELDQAYGQYKNKTVTARLGRQVITLDNHRHVGHVAWRQDKQTFDAARFMFTPAKDLKVDLSYVYKVNRINSPTFGDVDTDFLLANVSYKTPIGKLVGYHYGLSEDGIYDETDTTGFYLDGSAGNKDVKALYKVEYAVQDNKTEGLDNDYLLLEAGVKVSGITAKITYENIGSGTAADGTRENFVTPLSTIHAFQGWADIFLGGGLFGNIDQGRGIEDTYLTVSGKLAGVNLVGVYHDYESSKGARDLGSEFNFLAVKKLGKKYKVGLKYADYSKSEFTADDKEVAWAWVNVAF